MRTKIPSLLIAVVFSILTVLLSNSGSCQSGPDLVPDFTPEQEAGLSKAFGTYTSAVTVFTGRNAASSGSFSFDNNGGDFSVISIPLSHTFGDDGDVTRFKLRGAFGQFESRSSLSDFSNIYTQAEKDLPPELQGLPNAPDFRRDSVLSLTLGGGAVITPFKGFEIEGAFDVIWTHVKRQFDYNNFVSALLGTKHDRDAFNNSTESITYSPSLALSYIVDLGDGYSITPKASYTHLWTYDLWGKSRYADFAIDSGVLHSRLIGNIPLPFNAFGGEISLRPAFSVTSLYGAVRDSLEESTIYEYGADVALNVQDTWFSRLSLGATYITASDFSGYRINLGCDL